MKIEWLNGDRDKALLTRGWLKKRQTIVVRKHGPCGEVKWFYEVNGYYLCHNLWYDSDYMEGKRIKAEKANTWSPANGLPKATAL